MDKDNVRGAYTGYGKTEEEALQMLLGIINLDRGMEPKEASTPGLNMSIAAQRLRNEAIRLLSEAYSFNTVEGPECKQVDGMFFYTVNLSNKCGTVATLHSKGNSEIEALEDLIRNIKERVFHPMDENSKVREQIAQVLHRLHPGTEVNVWLQAAKSPGKNLFREAVAVVNKKGTVKTYTGNGSKDAYAMMALLEEVERVEKDVQAQTRNLLDVVAKLFRTRNDITVSISSPGKAPSPLTGVMVFLGVNDPKSFYKKYQGTGDTYLDALQDLRKQGMNLAAQAKTEGLCKEITDFLYSKGFNNVKVNTVPAKLSDPAYCFIDAWKEDQNAPRKFIYKGETEDLALTNAMEAMKFMSKDALASMKAETLKDTLASQKAEIPIKKFSRKIIAGVPGTCIRCNKDFCKGDYIFLELHKGYVHPGCLTMQEYTEAQGCALGFFQHNPEHNPEPKKLSPAKAEARKMELVREIISASKSTIKYTEMFRIPYNMDVSVSLQSMVLSIAHHMRYVGDPGPYFIVARNHHNDPNMVVGGTTELKALKNLLATVKDKYK